jgi:hypothetical protein
MAEYEHFTKPHGYAPPDRSGSAAGAIMLVGGIILLFLLAVMLMGDGGTAPVDPAAAPAVDGTPGPAVSQ